MHRDNALSEGDKAPFSPKFSGIHTKLLVLGGHWEVGLSRGIWGCLVPAGQVHSRVTRAPMGPSGLCQMVHGGVIGAPTGPSGLCQTVHGGVIGAPMGPSALCWTVHSGVIIAPTGMVWSLLGRVRGGLQSSYVAFARADPLLRAYLPVSVPGEDAPPMGLGSGTSWFFRPLEDGASTQPQGASLTGTLRPSRDTAGRSTWAPPLPTTRRCSELSVVPQQSRCDRVPTAHNSHLFLCS